TTTPGAPGKAGAGRAFGPHPAASARKTKRTALIGGPVYSAVAGPRRGEGSLLSPDVDSARGHGRALDSAAGNPGIHRPPALRPPPRERRRPDSRVPGGAAHLPRPGRAGQGRRRGDRQE